MGIAVVGVGPGNPEYVTLRAQRIISAAQLVAGFSSVLEVVRPWVKGRALILDYQTQEAQLRALADEANKGRECVICAWGDPNVSARELVERVKIVCPDVVVEPGVSSVQVACARAGLAMEESVVVTLHARTGVEQALDELVGIIVDSRRAALVLPRPWDLMPPALAAKLIERGISPGLQVVLYERLTLEDEQEHRVNLGTLAKSERTFSDLSILVIPAPGAD